MEDSIAQIDQEFAEMDLTLLEARFEDSAVATI